ncbi:MAG: sulfatase-like hydrolase/transferase [Pyrinomonadaceae bacterium]
MKRLTHPALTTALFMLTSMTLCLAQETTPQQPPTFDRLDPRADLLSEDNVLRKRLPDAGRNSTRPQAPVGAVADRPNIIVIITDDQPPNTIGLAGNQVIRTPNIDRLGQQGVYFENMYLPIGQCSPSRASIWTGKLPHTHGVTTNVIMLPPWQLTLPEILKANGYSTAILGKCTLGVPANPEKFKRGFDFRLVPFPDSGIVTNWYDYRVSRNGALEHHTEYLTDYITTQAIAYLASRASTGQPFFMWLSYNAPHLPTIPPRNSNRYTLDQMPIPLSLSDNLSSKPPQQVSSSPHQDYLRTVQSGNQIITLKRRLKDAYETISNIDDNVGRITQKLQDLGIRDNTVIIFMSDNGVFFGEHQLYVKGPFFYNEQIKSPFIFSYPPLTRQARKSSALATSIDIMPTLLDLVRIPIPQDVQGKSFLKLLSGESSTHRSSIFMEYFYQTFGNYPMRGVVHDRYKLVHYLSSTNSITGEVYDDRNFELYDLRQDPSEMNNILRRNGPDDNPLARMLTDPERGGAIRKLRKEMAVWQTDTLDPKGVKLSNMRIANIGHDTAELQWRTASATTSEIEYVKADCLACAPSEVTAFDLVTDHRVTLRTLTPDTPYKVRVYSIDSTGNGSYVDTLLTPTSTVSNQRADLVVTQTDSPDPVMAGDKLAYEITVTNRGPNAAQSVKLIDILPEEAAFLSASSSFGTYSRAVGRVKWDIGYMDNGASVKINLLLKPVHLGTNTNLITVSSGETDQDAPNNSVSQTTQVLLGLTKFTLSAAIVNGCENLTGTLVLSNPAPAGGAVVTLEDNLAGVTVPASVTVPAESASISFPVVTIPINSLTTQNGLITANLNGKELAAPLTVRRNGADSLTLTPNPVVGSNTVVGAVTLPCPAPPGGTPLHLLSSNPAVANPTASNITIPAGRKSLDFSVRTNVVTSVKTVTISATANGVKQSRPLRVNPRP